MWELYDTLINGIPDSVTVEDFVEGPYWTAVKSDAGGIGLAMKINVETRPPVCGSVEKGMKLRRLAEAAKSWNFAEASLGVAAINAFYNTKERTSKLGIDLTQHPRKHEAFAFHRERFTGKKVAVVGHFPYLETELSPICELSILERKPQKGDFPDSACEYILAEQDFVFITGAALVNKTLPRLLELSRSAYVVMTGPSVPLCGDLFGFGADNLSGYVVLDAARCFELVAQGHIMRNFDAGTMVSYSAPVPGTI